MTSTVNWTEVAAWLILVLGYMLALAGTVIPGLPGALFIVIAVLVHKFLLPDVYSWWAISVLIGLAIASWIVDFLAGIWGARLGGATRSGLWGAAIGGLLGIPFGFIGLILGPFFGAIAGDLYERRRDLIQLLRSGGGAALGFILSLVARFVLLFIMGLVLIFGAIF